MIFLTLVKYHCIGMLVLIFFFISLEESKYIKKGIILLVILVIFVFVLNYFFVFSVKGTTNLVSNSFYFNHLWNYVAGSLIYDNYIFSGDIDILHNVGYRFFSLFVAPINLFVRKFTGKAIFTCGIREFQFMGINGERGNVVDMIGYLFPVEQSIKEYIIFGLVIITLGYIFNMVYRRMINIEMHFLIFVASFLTFFIFFSFFGPFYVNFTPWEILAWSFIMLKIFDNRLKIVFKKSI